MVCYTRFPLVKNVIGTDHMCPSAEDFKMICKYTLNKKVPK